MISACGPVDTSIMTPAGPAASRINSIWWVLLIVATLIFVFIMSLLAIALFKSPEADESDDNPDTGVFMGNLTFVVINGVVMPAVVLTGIVIMSLTAIQTLSLPQDAFTFTIEVTGHQYWWEFYYRDYDVTTANELHIPVDEPVRIILHTEDVIHSFWIPEIQGKMDMIPGQINETWIEASEVGQYEGICTEFCGLQHANMRFHVFAENRDDFEAWVAQQQQPAPAPQNDLIERGWQVFQNEGNCAECHAIRGTNATGALGPELTHFASRLTIGAGTVPNTEGHLSGWIIDSQSIKPGSLMPPIELSGEDLEALVAYLQTLE